jgi:hypothetical protein
MPPKKAKERGAAQERVIVSRSYKLLAENDADEACECRFWARAADGQTYKLSIECEKMSPVMRTILAKVQSSWPDYKLKLRLRGSQIVGVAD